MKIDLLRNLDQMRVFRERWQALPETNPFGSFDFVQDWCELFPEETPFVVALSDEAGLVAIAPWAIERGTVRRLTGIWGEDAWFHDPIVRPGYERQAAYFLGQALLDSRKEWDRLHLDLRRDTNELLLEQLKRLGPVMESQVPWRQHRIIDFSEGWEAYWNSRSASFRKKVRALQRKLDELPHGYREADAENLEEWLDHLIRLHNARLGNLRDWIPTYALFRGMARRAFEAGRLTLTALEIRGRISAMGMQVRCGQTGYGILMAYDPEFSAYSVGTLLTVYSLERSCRSGCLRVDPGGGDDEYKIRLHSAIQGTVLVDAASPASLRGQADLLWQRETSWRLEERIKPWLRERPLLWTSLRALKSIAP